MSKHQVKLPEFTSHITTSKYFVYNNTGVKLDFTLQVDDQKQIKAFKKCLEKALEDINSILTIK